MLFHKLERNRVKVRQPEIGVLKRSDKSEQKICAIRPIDQIFVEDPKIEENKYIKNKWQLQNLHILKNAENKLRDLYLKLKHKNYTDVQLKDNTEFITKIFRTGLVNKHSNKNKTKSAKRENNDSVNTLYSSDNIDFQNENKGKRKANSLMKNTFSSSIRKSLSTKHLSSDEGVHTKKSRNTLHSTVTFSKNQNFKQAKVYKSQVSLKERIKTAEAKVGKRKRLWRNRSALEVRLNTENKKSRINAINEIHTKLQPFLDNNDFNLQFGINIQSIELKPSSIKGSFFTAITTPISRTNLVKQ